MKPHDTSWIFIERSIILHHLQFFRWCFVVVAVVGIGVVAVVGNCDIISSNFTFELTIRLGAF